MKNDSQFNSNNFSLIIESKNQETHSHWLFKVCKYSFYFWYKAKISELRCLSRLPITFQISQVTRDRQRSLLKIIRLECGPRGHQRHLPSEPYCFTESTQSNHQKIILAPQGSFILLFRVKFHFWLNRKGSRAESGPDSCSARRKSQSQPSVPMYWHHCEVRAITASMSSEAPVGTRRA